MKNPTDFTSEELTKLRVTFGLRRLSTALQNAVLSDGIIAQRVGIELSHPIPLPGGITVERDVLFKAFQSAADGDPIPRILDDQDAPITPTFEVENDAVVVTYESHRVSFPQAALLAANIERRLAVANLLNSSITLTQQARTQFFSLIESTSYTHDDFFAGTNIIAGAPETFADALYQTARKGTLGISDFLPKEHAHWENLIAKCGSSQTLADFVRLELAEERSARISQNPALAIHGLSLSFGTYDLVPFDALRGINNDDMLAWMHKLLDVRDPYALTAALDICADRHASDERFVLMGDNLLDKLISEPKRLFGDLATFATAFVIATAHLAQHEEAKERPVFWRRLAAAAHASLVTRVLGSDDEQELFDWAMRLRGKTFYISVLNDAPAEPRWKPDWISPNYLAADIYGRLSQVVQRLSENAPASWRKRIEDARSVMVKDVPPVADIYPSLLQGRRLDPPQMPTLDAPIHEVFHAFIAKPNVENFLMLSQLTFAFGFPVELQPSALAALRTLRAEVANTDPLLVRGTLQLGAFVAALNHDPDLAELVATVALERLAGDLDPDRLLSAATLLIECAAAIEEPSNAHTMLGRRLENMAFVAKPENLPEALDVFRILQSLNQALGPLLARATATARLGLPRIAVA